MFSTGTLKNFRPKCQFKSEGGGGCCKSIQRGVGWSTKFLCREISRNIYFVFREKKIFISRNFVSRNFRDEIKIFTGYDTFLNFIVFQYHQKYNFYVKNPYPFFHERIR
jgi:hypothetical protein